MTGGESVEAVPDVGEPPELSERFLAAMELAQTPEQQDVAREIYQRLAAGAQVEDVPDLIEKMVRVVVTQRGSAAAPVPLSSNPDDHR